LSLLAPQTSTHLLHGLPGSRLGLLGFPISPAIQSLRIMSNSFLLE
jgi:hypothetical protein